MSTSLFLGRPPIARSRALAALTVTILLAAGGALAQQQPGSGPLKPFKDALFAAEPLLEIRDGGDFKRVDYREARDIDARDETPERRVSRRYVDLSVKDEQADETLEFGKTSLPVTRVGPEVGQRFTVIFIHGRGGDRRLGADDWRFGGNFNRLKNLALRNGGTYYAPSVASFDQAGTVRIAALIEHARTASGDAPVVLSCASMGSFICWAIARDPAAVRALSGMVVMGGATDPGYQTTPAFKKKLPLFLTHGGADKVYKASDQMALYERLHGTGYPARLTIFETGSHGTPVRMSDWREMLNWIFTQKPAERKT